MRSIKAIVGDRETVTVDRQMSVADVARVMADRKIGAVPVLDGGQLVGIFSERDVLTRIVAVERDAAATSVGEVMSSGLVAADADESYETCLSRMQKAHVRHLIVLEAGNLAGIVSLRDLLVVDVNEKEEALTLLNTYVHHIPPDVETKLRS